MRISSAAALLLLAACGDSTADPAKIAPNDEDEGGIECAPRGNAEFTRTCTLERTQGDEGLILTVRQPDGGFHRLLVTTDGRGVVSADGAEPATVSVIADNRIEVAIGGARYRLPATVK